MVFVGGITPDLTALGVTPDLTAPPKFLTPPPTPPFYTEGKHVLEINPFKALESTCLPSHALFPYHPN